MALEFALRPRFSLEEPAPRLRVRRARLPRLVLPIAAYWLAMAGVTHALLRSAAEDSTDGGAVVAATPRNSEVDDTPPSAPLPTPQVGSLRTAQNAVSGLPSEPDFEPAPTAAPLVRAEPRARELPAPPAPAEEPAPRRTEIAVAPVGEKTAPLRSEIARAPVSEKTAPLRSEIARAHVSEKPARVEAAAASLPSCESAAASANETLDLGAARGAPDLTREAFAAVLENGAHFAHCALPARTALDICAAVLEGKVVGVSVTSQPQNPALSACVRRAVAGLRFPRSPRLDVTRTRFEAAR